MVNKTNLRLIAVAVMVVLAGAGLAQADLTDGLIAHWKLDEISGTTAADSAGTNDGFLVGNPNWTSGQIDGALELDGIDDYVSIGDKFNDVDVPFSICAWINTNGGALQSIFHSDDTGDPDSGNYYGWHFHLRPYNAIGISLGDGTGAGSESRRTKLSSSTIPTGQWTFVAAVVRDGTDMDLYINGQDAGGYYTGTGGVMVHRDYPAQIGMCSRRGPLPFDGTIDEVRIYDRALFAGEVEELYQEGLPALESIEIAGPDAVAEDSQVQYKAIASYENGSTKDVTDSADWSVDDETVGSIGADGLLETMIINRPAKEIVITAEYSEGEIDAADDKAFTVFAICPSGSALDFDGVDDYVEVPDTAVLSSMANITISAWINPHTITATRYGYRIISKRFPFPQEFVIKHSETNSGGSAGELLIGFYTETEHTTNFDLPVDSWTHLCVVWDGTKYVKVYKNGILNETVELDDTPSPFDSDALTVIGKRGSSSTEHFDGLIDDVRIYDKALTAEEVQAAMQTKLTGDEDGLIGYWDFDEGEGQVVEDLAGENDGTLGSDPNVVDSSDPEWIVSDAPIGYCSLGDMVGRNMEDVLEIKADILSQLAAAILIELDTYEMLDEAFEAGQLGTDSKSDIVKAKQKIHSAVQHESHAGDDVQKSLEKIDDAYDVLGIE